MLNLNKLLCNFPEQFDECLGTLDHSLSFSANLQAELRFHYVQFDGDGEPKFEQLAELLVHSIITYCFGAKKRENLSAVEAVKLFTQARDLFRKYEHDGQAGEVLIYFLLESVLGATQVIQKMPVTTNPKEERKGSDGLHARWNEKLGLLDIFFAESKLHQSFSGALTDAFESMESIHSKKKKHEFFLATHNIQHLGLEAEEELLKYFTGKPGTKIRTNHACLLGFDWKEYKNLTLPGRAEFIAAFADRYRNEALQLRDKIDSKLHDCAIKHLRFEFLVLPFTSVADFRSFFNSALVGK